MPEALSERCDIHAVSPAHVDVRVLAASGARDSDCRNCRASPRRPPAENRRDALRPHAGGCALRRAPPMSAIANLARPQRLDSEAARRPDPYVGSLPVVGPQGPECRCTMRLPLFAAMSSLAGTSSRHTDAEQIKDEASICATKGHQLARRACAVAPAVRHLPRQRVPGRSPTYTERTRELTSARLGCRFATGAPRVWPAARPDVSTHRKGSFRVALAWRCERARSQVSNLGAGAKLGKWHELGAVATLRQGAAEYVNKHHAAIAHLECPPAARGCSDALRASQPHENATADAAGAWARDAYARPLYDSAQYATHPKTTGHPWSQQPPLATTRPATRAASGNNAKIHISCLVALCSNGAGALAVEPRWQWVHFDASLLSARNLPERADARMRGVGATGARYHGAVGLARGSLLRLILSELRAIGFGSLASRLPQVRERPDCHKWGGRRPESRRSSYGSAAQRDGGEDEDAEGCASRRGCALNAHPTWTHRPWIATSIALCRSASRLSEGQIKRKASDARRRGLSRRSSRGKLASFATPPQHRIVARPGSFHRSGHQKRLHALGCADASVLVRLCVLGRAFFVPTTAFLAWMLADTSLAPVGRRRRPLAEDRPPCRDGRPSGWKLLGVQPSSGETEQPRNLRRDAPPNPGQPSRAEPR